LKLEGTTCLISTAEADEKVYKSARNIRGVEVLPAPQLNAYTVLKQKRLLLTRAALELLRKKNTKAEPS
jgi:large subunit ribosomal protein L4